ncbi:hypothetical protein EMMF5_005521 [Cystobasidiomycetes sp. EMM_F5]
MAPRAMSLLDLHFDIKARIVENLEPKDVKSLSLVHSSYLDPCRKKLQLRVAVSDIPTEDLEVCISTGKFANARHLHLDYNWRYHITAYEGIDQDDLTELYKREKLLATFAKSLTCLTSVYIELPSPDSAEEDEVEDEDTDESGSVSSTAPESSASPEVGPATSCDGNNAAGGEISSIHDNSSDDSETGGSEMSPQFAEILMHNGEGLRSLFEVLGTSTTLRTVDIDFQQFDHTENADQVEFCRFVLQQLHLHSCMSHVTHLCIENLIADRHESMPSQLALLLRDATCLTAVRLVAVDFWAHQIVKNISANLVSLELLNTSDRFQPYVILETLQNIQHRLPHLRMSIARGGILATAVNLPFLQTLRLYIGNVDQVEGFHPTNNLNNHMASVRKFLLQLKAPALKQLWLVSWSVFSAKSNAVHLKHYRRLSRTVLTSNIAPALERLTIVDRQLKEHECTVTDIETGSGQTVKVEMAASVNFDELPWELESSGVYCYR